MEKTLPLYLGPSVIGSVVCHEDERHVTLMAKTYATLSGICRAYVRGNESSLLVGVLAPEGTAFSAEKSITKTNLWRAGLTFDDITYAYALCPSNSADDDSTEWRKLDQLPDILCRDKVVCALAKSSDALADSNFAPTRIAVPLITNRPFPRPDILCLLTPCRINGNLYGVLGISKTGTPRKI